MTWCSRVLCVIILFLIAAMAPSGPTYDLSWHTIDGGGGLSMGGAYDLQGVIGQHDAGAVALTGGTFSLSGGFLAHAGGPACPADTDNSGTVNVTDLLQLLGAWGTCPQPCSPDINTDGNVNVTDLLALLANWGGTPALCDMAPPGGDGSVNVTDLLALLAAWGACP